MKTKIENNMMKLSRTQFVAQLVPNWIGPGDGSWLDACSGRVCPVYKVESQRKGYDLHTCSYNVREPGVKPVDLQKYQKRLGTYDLITSTDTLEHIADYMSALRNLQRYCRFYMIMSVPRGGRNGHVKVDPTTHPDRHEWAFNKPQLKQDLADTGWEVCGEYFTYSRPINCIGHAFFCTPTGRVNNGS